MTQAEKEILKQTLDALERLMRIFQIERVLYLLSAFASLVLFVYAAYRLFSTSVVTAGDMALILGATGVSTASSSRIAFFLNKAFQLIEDILRKLARTSE